MGPPLPRSDENSERSDSQQVQRQFDDNSNSSQLPGLHDQFQAAVRAYFDEQSEQPDDENTLQSPSDSSSSSSEREEDNLLSANEQCEAHLRNLFLPLNIRTLNDRELLMRIVLYLRHIS